MSEHGRPEGHWAQQPYTLSQDKPAQAVGGDAQEHARLPNYQNTPQIYASVQYEVQVGADGSMASFSEMTNDHEWCQGPAVGGTVSAAMPPALSAASGSRAVTNDTLPHHAHTHSNFDGVVPQMPFHTLGHPNRQGAYEHFTGRAPNLVPKRGPADAQAYVWHSGQGVGRADPFDGYGAYPLKISEVAGNGGTGAVTSVERVVENPWATATTAGEYSALHRFPVYTGAAQSPYDLRTRGYVEQDGIVGLPNSTQLHGLTAWSTQQGHGQSAPTMGSELPLSWGASGMNVPFGLEQTHPILHGFLDPGTQGVGAYIDPNEFKSLPTGVASSLLQHSSGGPPSYTRLNATVVTLAPPNHQVSSAIAANTTGNLVVPPTCNAGVAAPNPIEFGTLQISRTRTGRKGPKRNLPGRVFEPSLRKVQERLRGEGADTGAVERLQSEIFLDGAITKGALKAPMSLDQRRARTGTQRYMLVVEIVRRSLREADYQCLLCPFQARVEFKNREDTLRHLYKDHFGLSSDCTYCGHKFWLEKELAKHAKIKHIQS